jgi:diguanylate cyclase
MEYNNLDREKLTRILARLEQALIEHFKWHSSMMRSITCQLPVNACDLDAEAHLTCTFGQWYDSKENDVLLEFVEFKELGDKHKLMHQMAAELLIEAQEVKSVSTLTYDKFSIAIEDMRIQANALEHKLERLLFNHDPLTGAISRFDLLPALLEQQALIKRGAQPCCIVMMDFDNFKLVNDDYGHHIGDLVLSKSIRYVIEHLRPYDKIYRYGGEEFILTMQFTDLPAGYHLVERLREGIESLPIDIDGKKKIHITASFGIGLLDPNLPATHSIECADKAMYAAKHAGRNRVHIVDRTA